MAALAGKSADVYIVAASGAGTAFTTEACTANGARTQYQITNTSKRYWSTATAITVETSPDGVSWTTAGAGTYQLAYAGGIVIFPSAQAVGTQVRVTGAYLSVSQLANSFEWTLDISANVSEATVFGATWKAQKYTDRQATASLKKFWADEYFFTNLGNEFLLVLYMDQSAGTRYEGLFCMNSDSIASAQSGLVQESVSFTLDGPLNYSAT